MQSRGLLADGPHVLQCHAAAQLPLLCAQCAGGGVCSTMSTPSHWTISLSGSPVGVRNVLREYCIDVDDSGSGFSQDPEYGDPAVTHVLLLHVSCRAFGAVTPDASFSPQ